MNPARNNQGPGVAKSLAGSPHPIPLPEGEGDEDNSTSTGAMIEADSLLPVQAGRLQAAAIQP